MLLAAAGVASPAGTPVTISNKNPRRDSAGDIWDCHDGNILYVEGEYWQFCAAYGPCASTLRFHL